MEQEDLGRSPSGRAGGLRPEPPAESQPKALIPNAGDWLVFLRGRTTYKVARAEKVTAKLVMLVRAYGNWERRIERDDVVATFATKEDAERLQQAINGAFGEFARRVGAARAEFERREGEAMIAFKKAAERLICAAQGIEAREGGDAPAAPSRSDESPVAEGDAPKAASEPVRHPIQYIPMRRVGDL